MSQKWNKLEIDILATLLEELADRYSNDGCNDLTPEQSKIATLLNLKISDPDQKIHDNTALVHHLKNKLKSSDLNAVAAVSDNFKNENEILKAENAHLMEQNQKLLVQIASLKSVTEMIDKIKRM